MLIYILIGLTTVGILGCLAYDPDEPTLAEWYALAKNTKGGWDL